MNTIKSFDYLCGKSPKVLILGSIPGEKSIELGQYYAKKGNKFWPIIFDYFNKLPSFSYDERTTMIKQNHIALWDIIYSCERTTSLDSNIKKDTVVPNNILDFIAKYPSITTILLNGKTAEFYFKKYIINLPPHIRVLPALLSTSGGNPQFKGVVERQWKAALKKALDN